MTHELFKLSPRIDVVPVVHGSGDFAVEIRQLMLTGEYDCLAVPLPPSFQTDVEAAILHLPRISLVLQPEQHLEIHEDWSPDREKRSEDDLPDASFVPIDPCQPVIAALRIALEEHIPRAFIDLETARFESVASLLPDPYAVKQLHLERFAASILPIIPPPVTQQQRDRVQTMAAHLRLLEGRHRRILCLCSMLEWPWVRQSYQQQAPAAEDSLVEETQCFSVSNKSLLFLLSEFPFITALYEQARAELDDDRQLSLDGIKEVLISARKSYKEELKKHARSITPHLLANCLKYARNLSLIERRMTPDLYTLITAAQQFAGDQFAIHVAETVRLYPDLGDPPFPTGDMGTDRFRRPDGTLFRVKSRLPGHPVTWRSCQLKRRPLKADQFKWAMRWNPFSHCSWPPEDIAIERFRTHIKDHAQSLLGQDLARTEKFTTSLKDGLDLRETLRNWHTGELFIKVLPPNRGQLDCVIMLFDSPADPREYPWRVTWHAEPHDESTLSFFATRFEQELVGPGIALSSYGGAMFLFPPRPIRDIWTDTRFDFADTLEERLLAAGFHYAEHRHVAILSHVIPGAGWRRMAKKFGKKIIHVPMSHFSQEHIQQLRMFHVLNGKQVRSYAEHFIRRA